MVSHEKYRYSRPKTQKPGSTRATANKRLASRRRDAASLYRTKRLPTTVCWQCH